MIKYIIILVYLLLSPGINAEDSLLTLKQKLDRLQREVNDLSKTVFQSSRDENSQEINITDNNSDLTAFDLRIYDLEKDIKKLNASFEEIIFHIDDLKTLYDQLTQNLVDFEATIENINNKTNNQIKSEIASSEVITEETDQKKIISNEKNSLGTIVIGSEDLSNNNQNETDQDIKTDDNKKTLSPEEDFQIAFDLLRSQKFDEAKLSLTNFITNHSNNKLSGSAHYWLGELHLLKKDYREAALILAEGYQKFPKSIKAPDMLYKLADSLMYIDKKNDSCGTLKKLVKEFPNHQLSLKAENKIKSIECSSSTE